MNPRRIYGILLRLHPRDYREAFGEEILSVFEDGAAEHKSRGGVIYARFLIAELLGAITVAASQWVARIAAAPSRMPLDYVIAEGGNTVREAEMRIELSIERMTHAIANHDFAAARAWSYEERKAREEVRKLKDRYGFE